MKWRLRNGFLCVFPPVSRHDFEREKRKWRATPEWKRYLEFPIQSASVVRHWATGRLRFAFWSVVGVFGQALMLFVIEWQLVRQFGPFRSIFVTMGSYALELCDVLQVPFGFYRQLIVILIVFVAPLSVGFMYAKLIIKFIDARRIPFGFCRKCRYDLRGAEGAVCPECGTPRLRRATTHVTT